MKEHVFTREVLHLLPTFRLVEKNYFYEAPCASVLAGFAWEKPRGCIYVWKYAYPLYDVTDFMHFGYGDRLPHPTGFMSVGVHTEQAIAEEFVRRVLPYHSEVSQLRDLHCFAEYQLSRGLENPLLRRGYALTLIRLGLVTEAFDQLVLCLGAWKERPDFDDSIKTWMSAIKDGTAADMISLHEKTRREQLGL